MFAQKPDKVPPIQLNQISFISQFTTDIQYVKGPDNIVADAFSRVCSILTTPVDLYALAKDQESDTEIVRLLNSETALRLKKIKLPNMQVTLLCDTSTSTARPFVTKKFRKPIFNSLHYLNHAGPNASARLVSQRFVWPNVQKQCRLWARSCLICQQAKVTRHVRTPTGNFELPKQRFQQIHLDIVELPQVGPYSACLTIIDRFTRWVEAQPLINKSAENVAKALLQSWISRFGCPLTITTDQGRQFESRLFTSLGITFGMERSRTSSYHPASNGMIERFHRQLKASLMCHTGLSWVDALPIVLLGIRNTFKPDLDATPAEMVYGESLRLPGEFLHSSKRASSEPASFINELRQQMSRLRPVPASRHVSPHTVFIYKDLATCSHAFLRTDHIKKTLELPYSGPYRIVSRSDKTIELDINGRVVTVSLDRVKPFYTLAEEEEPIAVHSSSTSKRKQFKKRVRFLLP